MPDYATSIDIAAPPEIVFAHLTTVEGMLAWMGEHAELVPTPGGAFAVDVNGALFRGEFLEVDPPRRVVVSWGLAGSEDLPPGASRVEFTLTPTARGTTLELLHTGLPDPYARTHAIGWRHYLARLRLAGSGVAPGTDPGPPVS